MELQTVREIAARLRETVHEVVVGQDNAIDLLLVLAQRQAACP